MVQSDIEYQQQYYIHPDHLGSYNVVTTSNKAVAERYHFDPWGNRKNPTSWNSADTRTLFLFDRGFTGHEHLDFFKIINMNARLYDPVIGRFFSPDPYVQMPEFTQNFNRYSYCLNNPLKYVDPSGELFDNYYIYYTKSYQRVVIERNDDPTNTYIFFDEAMKPTILGKYSVYKSDDGKMDMINMRENQFFYNSYALSKKYYLTEDQAAAFLAATYDFYINNGEYKTDVMQFMALDFSHSGKPPRKEYAKFSIDLYYIRTDRVQSKIPPRTDKDNIDIGASYRLATTFQKYGLGVDIYSPAWGIIAQNAAGGPLFPKYAYDNGHQNHMHLQGFVIKNEIK